MKYHDLILFTGAGFTKNFGGFLASEMWSQIYNHPDVQKSETLRELLQNDFDFESVYSRVMEELTLPQEEKDMMESAVKSAYTNLDNAIREWGFRTGAPNPVNIYNWNKLCELFRGNAHKKGLFFTLNQDLFMERHNNFFCPGLPGFRSQQGGMKSTAFSDEDYIQLPPDSEAKAKVETGLSNHAGMSYIKLHGSYGWVASDGSSRMVIGKNKTKMIGNEPLLQEYFDIFTSAIKEGKKKLLIIGYGFYDKHINDVLADGVENHELRLFVISTSSPKRWKESVLEDKKNGSSLIKGLAGYYPYSLREIFPEDQSDTVYYSNIKRDLQA